MEHAIRIRRHWRWNRVHKTWQRHVPKISCTCPWWLITFLASLVKALTHSAVISTESGIQVEADSTRRPHHEDRHLSDVRHTATYSDRPGHDTSLVSSNRRGYFRRTARSFVSPVTCNGRRARPIENCGHYAGSQDRESRSQHSRATSGQYRSRQSCRGCHPEVYYPAPLRSHSSLDFSDQFAFRPSGSTTAAIVAMLHTVRSMMADNDYVHVF